MGFVEYHRVARGQELRQAFVAQHHVGEEQMMVDHDDVGLERRLARFQHEAFGMVGTVGAKTVVAGRRHQRPDRRVLGDVGDQTLVACLARAGKGDDLREMAGIFARRQTAFGRGAFEMVVADVVGAALEERERDRHAERGAHERQIALEELVLQRLRTRGDDDLAAVLERGDEIGERLAGAGARFGDQRCPRANRFRHRFGHRELLRPQPKAGERAGQRSAFAEDRGEVRLRG